MNIRDLLKEESIILHIHNNSKEQAIDQMVNKHFECGHINNKEIFKQAILAREKLSSTGVGNMIAIPHAQNKTVQFPALVAMVDKEGVDFDSLDNQPAKVFFMIAVPEETGAQHLEILAQLSQILMDNNVVKKLIGSQTPQHFLNILTGEMNNESIEEKKTSFDVLAVTACPTGIAHTYMAAKALEETAKKMGIKIKVETNGASGIKNALTAEEIEEAKCIIVAADKKVEMKRFNGKPIIQVPVADGIHKAIELLERATKEEIPIIKKENLSKEINQVKGIKIIYNHLMNGISNIIPLLMICGIGMRIIEMSGISYNYQYENSTIEFVMNMAMIMSVVQIFATSLFSAFIADSISDRPGFTVGLISSIFFINSSSNIFIVIATGFISGYLVLGLKKLFSFLPEVLDSLLPNLLLPICGTLIMLLITSFFKVSTLTATETVYNQVIELNPVISLIVGFILGAMMSIDMGGPVNKIAYTIGIIGIFIKRYDIMTAVMIGGMIPPLVIWLSMMIKPSLFTQQEEQGKWRCLIKGLCFVSEEAIPYMSNDRKGIHIPCIIASGLAGGLTMFFGCSQMFPHGGIFTLPLINNPFSFLIALGVAIIVGMSLVIILKKSFHQNNKLLKENV